MLILSLFMIFIYLPANLFCLSCFKCMTTDFDHDTCGDPFNPIDNHLDSDCLASSYGRNGLFPARFCVKISGIIVDVDRNVNRSLINKNLFLRTCITDNIMDSSRSTDSTGNFRLKNFNDITGVRMQGTITLCSHDGCNQAKRLNLNINFLLICLYATVLKSIKLCQIK
mgnify:CR=1 FL=1